MQYDYSILLWSIPGLALVAYGTYGAATRNITTYGRGGRRVTSTGKAALMHALGVVLLGLALIGFCALIFIQSAHA